MRSLDEKSEKSLTSRTSSPVESNHVPPRYQRGDLTNDPGEVGAPGGDLNVRPSAYKADALPLSYEGLRAPWTN